MTGLLARLRGVFVLPATGAAPVAVRRATLHIGVVGRPREAHAAACALVLSQARGEAGLVCVWGADAVAPRVPATAGARALAARLAARELEARASGRLVRVALPADPAEARDRALRAAAAAPGPVCVAVCGPRNREVDDLLAVQDALLVAGRPDADQRLLELARASLDATGVPVARCELAAGGLARVLALAGLAATGGLRAAVASAPALRA